MSATQRTDSIGRNAAFALASEVATAAFTALITIFLVRALDPADYGVFVLAVALAVLVAWPADFGISTSAARFIAERRGDPAAIADVFVRALSLKVVLASVAAGLLFALAEPIASAYDQPELVWPLRVVAVAVLGQGLVVLFASTFIAMRRTQWQFVLVFSEAANEAVATIAIVLLAGGATAAAFGRAVGYCCAAVLGALVIRRLLGRRAIAERRGAPPLRQFALYAGALMIIDGAYVVFSSVDLLLVGALLGAAAAGIYAAPLKLVAVLHYPGLATANAIAPRLARHGDQAPDVEAFAGSLRFLIIFQAAVAVTIAVWADPIVDLLLGSEYAESAEVLRAMAPLVFVQGFGPLVSGTANYLGEARRRIPVVVGCVILNVCLLVALVEPFDVIGAAVSLDISYAVYVSAHLWICARMIEIRGWPLIWTAVRVIPAAALLAAILFALQNGGLGPVEWVVGPVVGLGAFMAMLVAMRELSFAELRDVFRAIVPRLRSHRASDVTD